MLRGILVTALLSALPLIEFRFAIPIGVSFGAPLWAAVPVAMVVGVIVTKVLFKYLPLVVSLAERHWPWLHKVLDKIFEKTRREHSKKFELFSEIALVLFVAVPLPGSGVFSAALLVYLFDLPRKQSFYAICFGILGGGLLLAGLTLLGMSFFEFLQFTTEQGLEGVNELVE